MVELLSFRDVLVHRHNISIIWIYYVCFILDHYDAAVSSELNNSISEYNIIATNTNAKTIQIYNQRKKVVRFFMCESGFLYLVRVQRDKKTVAEGVVFWEKMKKWRRPEFV